MNDDYVFCVRDSDTFLPYDEKPLIIREIDDFELRFYFNPSRFNAEEIDIKPLITRLSLRAGISKPDLSRIRFGEIVVRLNPAISNERDIKFIKEIFLNYFNNLSPVTL